MLPMRIDFNEKTKASENNECIPSAKSFCMAWRSWPLFLVNNMLESNGVVHACKEKVKSQSAITHEYFLFTFPNHEGMVIAPIVLTIFQRSEKPRPLGKGPVEMNIPLGARYLALLV